MRDTARIRNEFVDLWGRLASFWGISPAAARAYAFLLSAREGATAAELCEGLGMSRGAVSMSTRELREWGLAVPEKQPRSREVRWRLERDVERVVRSIVATRKRREWDPILEHVDGWIAALKDEKGEDNSFLRDQLETIGSIVELVDDMAQRFLGGSVVDRLALGLLVHATRRKRRRKATA